jgi:hypothetical protein
MVELGLKKYLWFWFPTDPTFFCRSYVFFNAIDRVTLFSPGGCGLLIQRAKMASGVTLIITRKYMHAETLALLTKPFYFPNVKYLK